MVDKKPDTHFLRFFHRPTMKKELNKIKRIRKIKSLNELILLVLDNYVERWNMKILERYKNRKELEIEDLKDLRSKILNRMEKFYMGTMLIGGAICLILLVLFPNIADIAFVAFFSTIFFLVIVAAHVALMKDKLTKCIQDKHWLKCEVAYLRIGETFNVYERVRKPKFILFRRLYDIIHVKTNEELKQLHKKMDKIVKFSYVVFGIVMFSVLMITVFWIPDLWYRYWWLIFLYPLVASLIIALPHKARSLCFWTLVFRNKQKRMRNKAMEIIAS